MPENDSESISEIRQLSLIDKEAYKNHVWSLLRWKVNLVRLSFEEREKMAWAVEMERGVGRVIETVK
jgi:hypothetical protein